MSAANCTDHDRAVQFAALVAPYEAAMLAVKHDACIVGTERTPESSMKITGGRIERILGHRIGQLARQSKPGLMQELGG